MSTFPNITIVLSSDHGLTFQNMAAWHIPTGSSQGEHRNPLLVFVVPKALESSHIIDNMETHTNSIVTPFDVYRWLIKGVFPPWSIDLRLPLNSSRSCHSSRVVPHYCSCHSSLKFDYFKSLGYYEG
jgi:hypothetical protein